MQRRKFIKSIIGSSVLMLGGVTAYQWYQQASLEYPVKLKTTFLSQDDQLILNIFIPVFAAGMPNKPQLNISIKSIDQAINILPLRTQDELRELFDLLSSSVGRLILAGVWLNWQEAESKDIDEFLLEWRASQLSLLQQAYVGLHQLIIGSIYAEPTHWDSIGYPGPLKLA